MTVNLKRNDTKDVISYITKYPNGSIVDLTGATVRFIMGKGNKLITESPANVVNASTGEVEYQLQETDTAIAGTFNAEFEVTFSDGKIKTFPNDGYIEVKITPNIDSNKTEEIILQVALIEAFKTETNTKVNNMQAQIDQLVVEGDSSVEAAQARVEADGTVNATLKARLDKKEAEFTAQMAQTTTDMNSRSINVMFPPAPLVAAKGDWNGITGTDDTTAINGCLEYMYSQGGGVVYVPPVRYKTTNNLKVKDNVSLIGAGYGSWIENVATSGFSKCTVVTGNIGDITNNNGIYAETKYELNRINAGATAVTLFTSVDVGNFQVGDIVAIISHETWNEPFPENTPIYNNLNVIDGIEGSTLKLKYSIPDTYSDLVGKPKISRLSGTINGYDGTPLWMSKNAQVKNLRLTQSTGLNSGWYAVFACGINCTFEDIWMDNVSSLFGSNGLGYSTVRNIRGRFEAGLLDFCDFQINNTYENIEGSRFAQNPSLNNMGVSFHSGADLLIKNVKASLGNKGGFNAYHVHRATIENPVILDSDGGAAGMALLTGYGHDVKLINPYIDGCDKHGVVIYGERADWKGGNILNVGRIGIYYSGFVHQDIKEYVIQGVKCGKEGSRTTKDQIIQNNKPIPVGIVKDNYTYVSPTTIIDPKTPVVDSAYAETSSLNDATLKTYAITGGATRKAKAFKVYAIGARSGVSGTKQIKLKLGNTDIAVVNYGTSDTEEWSIEAIISNSENSTTARIYGKGLLGQTIQYGNRQDLSEAFTANTSITLVGSVANASDKINVYQFVVEPIG